MAIQKKNKISPSLSVETLAKYFRDVQSNKPICCAPFTALYFHPDGEVGACCLNKGSYQYGRYPESNLNEIINSIPRKVQQQHINGNNLSLGCTACELNIKLGNFSGLMSRIYSKLKPNSGIQRIDFELSNICNLNCLMCERDKSNQPNKHYNKKFIKEVTPFLKKLRFANFIGGEPFLINEYYDIWDILLKENPSCIIYVQTNGTLLNERVKELIKHNNFHVGISLDSVKKETLEKIRPGLNFEEILRNFEFFNNSERNKNTRLQISVCPLRINKSELPEVVNFANRNNCSIFFNLVENPNTLSLKQIPSKYLENLTNMYDYFISNLKSETDVESANKSSFNELNLLLKYWYKKAIMRESESVIVRKKQISELLRATIEEEFPEIYNKLTNKLPKEFYMSKIRFSEIESIDLKKTIYELYENGNKENEIIEAAIRFFELYRTENLSYE